MKTKLLSDTWRRETLAIRRAAADLLAEGQSVVAAEAFIASSLDALELKLCVESAAYKAADAAFARVLQRRRPPRARG